MDTSALIQAESTYLIHTYNRPDIVLDHGEGVYLYDTEGNKYLDFMAGIAVAALGHGDPEWVTAVQEQAAKLTHVSNLYYTAPYLELAQRLVNNSFADRVFFCNTGSEANEGAIKFARKYAREIGEQRLEIDDQDPNLQSAVSNHPKHKIVAFTGGFHGRSIGALSLTHKEKYRMPFAPLMPGVSFAPYNDLDAAAMLVGDDTCAVVVEPVQGEGGVNPATPEFLRGLRELCDTHDATLIFDEVQCGLGRTGYLWAYQGYGVEPDIMTLAKPLAGGLPIGAILARQPIADVIKPGDHGSTFAAGPVVCRAAQVVFDRINQPAFLQQIRDNGEHLRHRLNQLEADEIAEIRGKGLLIGVELKSEAAPVVAAAREKGLLIIVAGENVLRLAPPLVVSQEEIDFAVETIGECLT